MCSRLVSSAACFRLRDHCWHVGLQSRVLWWVGRLGAVCSRLGSSAAHCGMPGLLDLCWHVGLHAIVSGGWGDWLLYVAGWGVLSRANGLMSQGVGWQGCCWGSPMLELWYWVQSCSSLGPLEVDRDCQISYNGFPCLSDPHQDFGLSPPEPGMLILVWQGFSTSVRKFKNFSMLTWTSSVTSP